MFNKFIVTVLFFTSLSCSFSALGMENKRTNSNNNQQNFLVILEVAYKNQFDSKVWERLRIQIPVFLKILQNDFELALKEHRPEDIISIGQSQARLEQVQGLQSAIINTIKKDQENTPDDLVKEFFARINNKDLKSDIIRLCKISPNSVCNDVKKTTAPTKKTTAKKRTVSELCEGAINGKLRKEISNNQTFLGHLQIKQNPQLFSEACANCIADKHHHISKSSTSETFFSKDGNLALSVDIDDHAGTAYKLFIKRKNGGWMYVDTAVFTKKINGVNMILILNRSKNYGKTQYNLIDPNTSKLYYTTRGSQDGLTEVTEGLKYFQ
jgi:hypothetical protein